MPLGEKLYCVGCGKHAVLPIKPPRVCVWVLLVPNSVTKHNGASIKCLCDTELNNMWSSGPTVTIREGRGGHSSLTHTHTTSRNPTIQFIPLNPVQSDTVAFSAASFFWHSFQWPGEQGNFPVNRGEEKRGSIWSSDSVQRHRERKRISQVYHVRAEKEKEEDDFRKLVYFKRGLSKRCTP